MRMNLAVMDWVSHIAIVEFIEPLIYIFLARKPVNKLNLGFEIQFLF